MRPEFEHTLEQYSSLAKRFEQADAIDADEAAFDELSQVMLQTCRRAAQNRSTTPEEQQRIFDIQQQKQAVMQELRRQFAAIDDPESNGESDARALPVRYEGGRFTATVASGEQVPVTLGDLLTDADWGITYRLDRETVPRSVRKRYAIERAKHELRQLLDEQIMINEIGRPQTDQRMREVYQRIGADHALGVEHLGIIAERMARNFLEKLGVDYADIGFRIERVDVYEDAADKIDFIIHRTPRRRGVRVEVPSHTDDAGIQFTTVAKPEVLRHKEEQIRRSRPRAADHGRIDDIVLVSIPRRVFEQTYRDWQAEGRPGGPDRYWDPQAKENIFRHVLAGIFTRQELGERWQSVAGREFGGAPSATR